MKTRILKLLREAKGYVSGQELCETLGVSRTAVWKVMKSLQEEGYRIEAVKNKGYCLCEAPDSVKPEEVLCHLHTEWLGQTMLYQRSIDSTNTWAKKLAEEGAAHGTVVTADVQTGGKGRRGREWVTPEGEAIAMTILLRPDILPERASMLTLVMGLSVVQACKRRFGIDSYIKWPNDAVIGGKKICGILTEMNAQIDYINYIVVGTGINVNLTEIPTDLIEKATSLYLETGRRILRAEVLAAVLEIFEKNYETFLKTCDLSALMEEYNQVLINRDQPVRVLEPGSEYDGIARGINEKGELLVEKADKSVTQVYAGEVSVRGVYGYV